MDIQVGDKIKFEYKRSNTPRNGVVTKIHSNGRFSVKPDGNGYCLNFRADWTHENYTILSVERPDKPKEISFIEPVNEHQKIRELIALSSLLLRLAQTGEATTDHEFDYRIAIDNSNDAILIDHSDEGFDYWIQSKMISSRPLKNVSMLRTLIMYGEED